MYKSYFGSSHFGTSCWAIWFQWVKRPALTLMDRNMRPDAMLALESAATPPQVFEKLQLGWTFCLLCNKNATDEHIASQTHQEAYKNAVCDWEAKFTKAWQAVDLDGIEYMGWLGKRISGCPVMRRESLNSWTCEDCHTEWKWAQRGFMPRCSEEGCSDCRGISKRRTMPCVNDTGRVVDCTVDYHPDASYFCCVCRQWFCAKCVNTNVDKGPRVCKRCLPFVAKDAPLGLYVQGQLPHVSEPCRLRRYWLQCLDSQPQWAQGHGGPWFFKLTTKPWSQHCTTDHIAWPDRVLSHFNSNSHWTSSHRDLQECAAVLHAYGMLGTGLDRTCSMTTSLSNALLRIDAERDPSGLISTDIPSWVVAIQPACPEDYVELYCETLFDHIVQPAADGTWKFLSKKEIERCRHYALRLQEVGLDRTKAAQALAIEVNVSKIPAWFKISYSVYKRLDWVSRIRFEWDVQKFFFSREP